MKYWIALLSVISGIAIGSFCIGQGKATVNTQGVSDVRMSDPDKIEKLLGEVAELQKKLAVLTEKYKTHTHQVRDLQTEQLPASIECNQNVVRWSSTGDNRESVVKVCRQIMSGNISVFVRGTDSPVTGPPRP